MRWAWRRRPKAGRVVFIGIDAPWDVAAALAAVPTPSPVVSAWVPDDEDGRDGAWGPRPAEEAGVGAPAGPDGAVQLGFADGTTMTLSDDDPRAVALKAAAARLTGAH